MPKKGNYSPPLLLSLATILLCLGWLMPSFPLLIFLGLAPLFAFSDRSETNSPILERMEFVLLALGISWVAYAVVWEHSIVVALVAAIIFTLAFVAHVWVWQSFGIRTGKLTLILFWLSIEYIILKLTPENGIFLADALRLQGNWMRWTIHTGYLGGSLWILLVNWCWYQAFLQDKSIHWSWLAAGILMLFGPAAYSVILTESPITRQDMISLYRNQTAHGDVTYLARGELVVRTAAWLSTLILLFAFVKSQTKKR
jgi:apolipoprotein N-acyltransferase